MRATTPRRSLGEHIKTRRKRLGILQRELGQTVGCDRRTISCFERGQRVPEHLLPRLATALDVSVEALTADAEPLVPTRDEIDLLTAYRALPDEGRAHVRGLVADAAAWRVTR